jgi:hypothetical protein
LHPEQYQILGPGFPTTCRDKENRDEGNSLYCGARRDNRHLESKRLLVQSYPNQFMKRRLLCLLFAVIIVSTVPAATPPVLWNQRYDGPGAGSDNSFAVVLDSSGNVFVTGKSVGASGFGDYVTLKYSNDGIPVWTNRYHGLAARDDGANALAVDSQDDVIVTGASAGGGNQSDCVTIKYSNAGVSLWTNRFVVAGDTAIGNRVQVDASRNVFVSAYTYAHGLVTLKYSTSGAPVWTNYFGETVNTYAYASGIAIDTNGQVFVAGISARSGSGDDWVTLAYSNSGVLLWTNRWDGPSHGDDHANALALDSAGNIFVTGDDVNGGGTVEFLTLKYSNAGAPLWTNTYPGHTAYGGATRVAVDPADNVIVMGAETGSTTYEDFTTIKYSNNGTPLWTNYYRGTYGDIPNALAIDRDGDVFETGYTTDTITLRFDRFTVAYSSTGALLWTQRYNGTGNSDDSGNAIAVDANYNVYVTGYSGGTNGTPDIVTTKYGFVRPPLNAQQLNNSLVLSWTNSQFALQFASSSSGPFVTMPSATSPYTNSIGTSPQFFRLKVK